MRPVRSKITVDLPIEVVHRYLLDISSRPEFAPDVFFDFRLTRIESQGVGAGARFRLHPKFRDRYAGTTIVGSEPERILESGSTGRSGRVPLVIEYLLEQSASGITRVQIGFETRPEKLIDRLREFGLRRRLAVRLPRAMRRLRDILEGTKAPNLADRPTVAGVDRHFVPNP